MRFIANVLLPAGGGDMSYPLCIAEPARHLRINPAVLSFLTILAVLAPVAVSQALTSRPLPLQMQPQQINVRVKQPILLAPQITTVTPQTCVRAAEGTRRGEEVTLGGSNFGSPRPAASTLAVQPAGGTIKPVTERIWTSTSITFSVPAGLAAGSKFTVGILNAGAFAASTQLTVCARNPAVKAPAVVQRTKTPFIRQFVVVPPASEPSAGPPEITSVSPADCVKVGKTATASGVNLGTSKIAAGFSLGYQAVNEPPTREIAESSWSPTSVSFIVPEDAGVGGWFALGIIFESNFYAQQYVSICGAYSGQGGYYGGDYYDSGDYGYQDSWGGAPVPKGARVLGPGGVDIQIEPFSVPETAGEQPPQSGRRVVGGKLLAMKALASKGLRKVNKECDLYDPHCPCCRKDDSVCLEKESDAENGTSVWVAHWKRGAKTVDGQSVYDAQTAEEDVEAVTGLQCDAVVGGDAGSADGAKLNCR